ncbi:MAG TPA: hypothetical protein VG838_07860 [Opitutaceae bacterium]|nr:hypothetical protein [Opitutaceae bacterium]
MKALRSSLCLFALAVAVVGAGCTHALSRTDRPATVRTSDSAAHGIFHDYDYNGQGDVSPYPAYPPVPRS